MSRSAPAQWKPDTFFRARMKTLQTTFFLFVFVPLVNSAPPIQQESLQFYEYDTDVTMGSLIQQDYEMQSKDIRKVFYLYYQFNICNC